MMSLGTCVYELCRVLKLVQGFGVDLLYVVSTFHRQLCRPEMVRSAVQDTQSLLNN